MRRRLSTMISAIALVLVGAGDVARADEPVAVPTDETTAAASRRTGELAILSTTNPPRFVPIDPPPPRLPAPFLLPDLAHPQIDIGLDEILGWGTPSPRVGGRGVSFGGIVRPFWEANIGKRHLYLGFSYPIAMGLPPDGGLVPGQMAALGGLRTLGGNAETHIRALFPLPSNLEIGFTMGVIAPTATYDRDSQTNRSISALVASFDPTSYLLFQPGRVALRPAADVRIRRGPLTVQVRHGLDIIIDDAGIESARLAGRLLGHVGVTLRRDLELSVEASQIYFFASDDKIAGSDPSAAFTNRYRFSDDHRAAFAIGPALRYATPLFDIGGAVVTNIGTPFSPVIDSMVAFRLSFVTHVGRVR